MPSEYINLIGFRAELSKPALMDFIAKTSAEVYYLVIPKNSQLIYGLMISGDEQDVTDYIANEFIPLSFELIPPTLVQRVAEAGGKECGNKTLLEW